MFESHYQLQTKIPENLVKSRLSGIFSLLICVIVSCVKVSFRGTKSALAVETLVEKILVTAKFQSFLCVINNFIFSRFYY